MNCLRVHIHSNPSWTNLLGCSCYSNLGHWSKLSQSRRHNTLLSNNMWETSFFNARYYLLAFRILAALRLQKRVVPERTKHDKSCLWRIEDNSDIEQGGPAGQKHYTTNKQSSNYRWAYRHTISNTKNFQIKFFPLDETSVNGSILTKEMSRKTRSIVSTITRRVFKICSLN